MKKKLPPFARELADARRRGLVPELPEGYFMVRFGWGVHRRLGEDERWPNIVIPLDAAIQEYDFRPLAGLDLLLVFERTDEGRVQEIEDCLLSIRPRSLVCLGLPEPHGSAADVVGYRYPVSAWH